MDGPSNLTDAQLMDQLADVVSTMAELQRTQEEPLRAELLRRQQLSGELMLTHNGWQSSLTREAFSTAWLKRTVGYAPEDLPPECFTRETKEVISWSATMEFLRDRGHEPETTYALKFQRQKTKAQ